MRIEFIIYLLFTHWLADFVLQDEKWALNKSKSWKSLLQHTCVYSAAMGLMFIPVLWNPIRTIVFFFVCFITHTTIDYITSRVVAKRFKRKYLGGPIPNFGAFTIIGFDQWLHYITLILTLQYLLSWK